MCRRARPCWSTPRPGGVGMAAVEIGKILGATVIRDLPAARAQDGLRPGNTGARSRDRLPGERLSREEVLKAHPAAAGVDRVYDPVGGDCLRPVAALPRGRGAAFCPIGFAGGTIPQIPANILLVKVDRRDGLQTTATTVGWSPHDARFRAGQADLRPGWSASAAGARRALLPAACRSHPTGSTRRRRRCRHCSKRKRHRPGCRYDGMILDVLREGDP